MSTFHSSKKLNKFKTSLPKKGAFTIETEPDFPKLHTLCIASGKRGGGKSIATANFIKSCKDKNYYDRVWLVTPTYYSNKAIWDIAEIEEEDTFEPDVTVLKDITKMVEAERAEWDHFSAPERDVQEIPKGYPQTDQPIRPRDPFRIPGPRLSLRDHRLGNTL